MQLRDLLTALEDLSEHELDQKARVEVDGELMEITELDVKSNGVVVLIAEEDEYVKMRG